MTRRATQPRRDRRFSRARVRARRVAVTLVALLVAGELAGCAGIANPYQTASTATRTNYTPTAATPADTGDPTPERNGSVPGHDQSVIDRLGAGAGRTSPQTALARYAELYVNWTAGGVAANQRQLAAISLGQARAQALQAAANLARDPELTKKVPSQTPAASSRSPRGKARQPDSGWSSHASRPSGRATTPDCRRPCTSSTPS